MHALSYADVLFRIGHQCFSAQVECLYLKGGLNVKKEFIMGHGKLNYVKAKFRYPILVTDAFAVSSKNITSPNFC